MDLEDKQFEDWKAWALAQVEREKQLASASYTGNEEESLVQVEGAPVLADELEIDGENQMEKKESEALPL
jgi:hypothetical protein